jgi:WXG100 family type VII secretion target
MALIKVTPESLKSQAADLRKKNAEHEQVYGSMKQLVSTLVDQWQGEAQSAFLSSFTQKEVVFKQFAEEIEKFSAFMDRAADTMQAAEDELKSQAQQLG